MKGTPRAANRPRPGDFRPASPYDPRRASIVRAARCQRGNWTNRRRRSGVREYTRDLFAEYVPAGTIIGIPVSVT
jgi:hypothetical protein